MIKEVADVTFYEIDSTGARGKPVLFLDTLKVSTIEQTAETADARGGKGNPKLITWDYGKEITVSIEDALFSPKSMSIMLGNGSVATSTASIDRAATVRATASSLPDYFLADIYDANQGAVRKKIWMSNTTPAADAISYASATALGLTLNKVYDASGNVICSSASSWGSTTGVTAGDKFIVSYTLNAAKKEITISGDSFPGTYYITGDTYARSDVTGKDQFFQFVIPKAKMTAEQTITLEAEGDPSTFNMNLTVLRPEDGNMMYLSQYDLTNG